MPTRIYGNHTLFFDLQRIQRIGVRAIIHAKHNDGFHIGPKIKWRFSSCLVCLHPIHITMSSSTDKFMQACRGLGSGIRADKTNGIKSFSMSHISEKTRQVFRCINMRVVFNLRSQDQYIGSTGEDRQGDRITRYGSLDVTSVWHTIHGHQAIRAIQYHPYNQDRINAPPQ